MLRHLGYMGATQSVDACTSRGCRPSDASPDRLRGLIRANLADLIAILAFNAEHGILFYRVCSQIIPRASDPGNRLAWWDEFAAEFETLGELVGRHGLRLEMHPGHYSLLNAPSPETVALSILELGWHVRFLEAMRLDASHKLVIRVGGTFGDKAGAIDRFAWTVGGLPAGWRGRMVVENDPTRYSVADALGVSGRTGLPVVFGRLQHRANPGDGPEGEAELIARCFRTWGPADGPPIVHLASPSNGRRGAAFPADWVEPDDLETLEALAPDGVPFDCMLEATQADRSLFDLRERMAIRESGARATAGPATVRDEESPRPRRSPLV